MQLHKDILVFDNVASVCENIQNEIRSQIFSVLHRRGAVVGISGGVDSSVTLALAATSLGATGYASPSGARAWSTGGRTPR